MNFVFTQIRNKKFISKTIGCARFVYNHFFQL
nr:helix-turn-helix domain-containing protein [Siminovitchia terrae]